MIFASSSCSITVITGMAGQISLCQATFAGIGGFATAQLVDAARPAGAARVLIGAVVAAAVGALLAIPALRLGGIYLSLATLAFALFFDNIMVTLDWVGGGPLPPIGAAPADRPHRLRRTTRASSCSASSSCCSSALALILVRKGTTGASSPRCAAARSPRRRSASTAPGRGSSAFALSAGIAGLGGGLLAMHDRQVELPAELLAVLRAWCGSCIVVTLGVANVEGAMQAAFGFIFFPLVILQQAGRGSSTTCSPGTGTTWTRCRSVCNRSSSASARSRTRSTPKGSSSSTRRKSLTPMQRGLASTSRNDGHAGGDAPTTAPRPREQRHEPARGRRDITKTFAGITALDEVSLDVEPGEIVGLIGPNGAGKTTFFNCLLGMLKPDRGTVTLRRAGPHPGADAPPGPSRDRPHVPTHRAVRRDDAARPPARRRAGRGAATARSGRTCSVRGRPKADELARGRRARSRCSGSTTSPTGRSRRSASAGAGSSRSVAR